MAHAHAASVGWMLGKTQLCNAEGALPQSSTYCLALRGIFVGCLCFIKVSGPTVHGHVLSCARCVVQVQHVNDKQYCIHTQQSAARSCTAVLTTVTFPPPSCTFSSELASLCNSLCTVSAVPQLRACMSSVKRSSWSVVVHSSGDLQQRQKNLNGGVGNKILHYSRSTHCSVGEDRHAY